MMKTNLQKPVIFLAFANDREDNARYLRNIPAEYNAIRQTLIAAQDKGLCEVEMLPYSTFQDIKNIFTAEKYRNRIAVFHFSGHADGFQLLLENADGTNELAHGKGLVDYFSILKTQNIQKELKLLFFNGCCTAQLGEDLQGIIPAVIGTVNSVNDAQAKAIAVSFYENLSKQINIKTAFDLAKAERHVGSATLRGLYRKELEGEPTAEPWQMYGKDDKVLEWKLEKGMNDNYVFNEQLTKQIITAIQPHSNSARKFLERAGTIPQWESQKQISDKAKEVIAYSFAGVIGIQFSKLMAIGKEDLSEGKQKKYVEKCLFLVKRSVDLVNFALLSKLWDYQKSQKIPLDEAQSKTLQTFFEHSFEADLSGQIALLQNLHEIFSKNKLAFPFSEMADFAPCFVPTHAFSQTCGALQQLGDKYSLAHCFEAERLLIAFFEHFHFLANYKMASIKSIGYKETRNEAPHYLHRYTALGVDSKANVDAEKYNYTSQTAQTDSVLLYKGENYQENINLFPFVIDYNALTFESGAKICFYRCTDVMDGSLEYVFLEDNSLKRIEYKQIEKQESNLSELLGDKEKAKILNLDHVFLQFQQAEQAILGKEAVASAANVNFDDLFD